MLRSFSPLTLPDPALTCACPCLHRGSDVMDLLITLTTGRGVALLNSTQVTRTHVGGGASQSGQSYMTVPAVLWHPTVCPLHPAIPYHPPLVCQVAFVRQGEAAAAGVPEGQVVPGGYGPAEAAPLAADFSQRWQQAVEGVNREVWYKGGWEVKRREEGGRGRERGGRGGDEGGREGRGR